MNEYSENLILRTMRENDMSYLEAIKKLDKEAEDRMIQEFEEDDALWNDSDEVPFERYDDGYEYEEGWG